MSSIKSVPTRKNSSIKKPIKKQDFLSNLGVAVRRRLEDGPLNLTAENAKQCADDMVKIAAKIWPEAGRRRQKLLQQPADTSAN